MSVNSFDLSGKVAVVTGSSRGIGRAIAELFAEAGAKVVISARNQGPCDEAAAAIQIFRVLALVLAFMLELAAPSVAAQVAASDIALPAGGSERVLFIAAERPRGTVILLAGGDAVFAIDGDGNVRPGGNFLVRTREHWPGLGFNAVVPGPPNGQSLIGRRSTPAYAAELERVVDFARSRSRAPVWVVGTSQGSTGAVNAGAHLGAKLGGVVLTSSVTQRSRSGETVFDADPGLIAVSALVVANIGDTCRATPPGDAPRILAALVRSPRKEFITFESHESQTGPCQAFSPHGYFGIEANVVRRIGDWIAAASPR